MDALLTFLLVATWYLYSQYLTLSPGLLKPLPNSEMYCGINHSIPRLNFTYSNQHILIKLRPNFVNPSLVTL